MKNLNSTWPLPVVTQNGIGTRYFHLIRPYKDCGALLYKKNLNEIYLKPLHLFSCWDCNLWWLNTTEEGGRRVEGWRGGGRMVNQFSWLFTKQSWGVVVYLNYPSGKTSCLVAHQYLNPLVLTSGHATYWAQNPPANKGSRTNHKKTSLSSENLFPECSLQAR